MKIRRVTTCLVIAIMSLNAAAIAAQPDEASLLDLEQRWIDASKAHDVDTLNAMIDDSYQATIPGGTQSKSDMLKPVPPGVVEKLQNVAVKVDGDSAIVTGENVVTFASGRMSRLAFVDKFARSGGVWRVVSSLVTEK